MRGRRQVGRCGMCLDSCCRNDGERGLQYARMRGQTAARCRPHATNDSCFIARHETESRKTAPKSATRRMPTAAGASAASSAPATARQPRPTSERSGRLRRGASSTASTSGAACRTRATAGDQVICTHLVVSQFSAVEVLLAFIGMHEGPLAARSHCSHCALLLHCCCSGGGDTVAVVPAASLAAAP